MLGGRLHAQYPDDDDEAVLHLPQPRLPAVAARACGSIGLLELLRFAWYFLVTKRSPGGSREWLRLMRQGRRERFTRRNP